MFKRFLRNRSGVLNVVMGANVKSEDLRQHNFSRDRSLTIHELDGYSGYIDHDCGRNHCLGYEFNASRYGFCEHHNH